MSDFLKRISEGEIFVADGAMGSMLIAQGLKVGDCPEAYNLSDMDILEDIAKKYYEAGAEIIQTNTFGGSPLKLMTYALDNKAVEINQNAVKAVRSAVGSNAFISGSIGPSGKLLEPYGSTSPEQVYESFLVQARALIEADVDILCVETMTDLNEAVLALKAVREISSDIPLMATMTYDRTEQGFISIFGVTIQQASEGLKDAGADIVGSNCGNGIEGMIEVAKEYKRQTNLPLIIQSNAGLPEIDGLTVVYNESPEFMARHALTLKAIGVSVIGGCCGTTPDHISAIKKAVKA